jgi:hypothetical protein
MARPVPGLTSNPAAAPPPPRTRPPTRRRLRQLKAARKQLRDFNAASAQQLESQVAAMEEACRLIGQVRGDLDAIAGRTR